MLFNQLGFNWIKIFMLPNAERIISGHGNIEVKRRVDKIQKDKSGSFLFFGKDADKIAESKKVVVTTGTFLGGLFTEAPRSQKVGESIVLHQEI